MTRIPGADACKRSLTDLVEGYYVIHVLDFLHREGVFADLATGDVGIVEISQRHGWDPKRLAPLIHYVSLRSDLVQYDANGAITVSDSYVSDPFAAHLLDQYVGGYGPCLAAMPELLRDGRDGSDLVNRERHARAFAIADRARFSGEVLQLLCELQVHDLVDLGCGTGGLLLEYAEKNPGAYGIGIDASPEAARRAHEGVRKAKLADRLEIICADVRDADTALAVKRRESVQALVAVSIANAFFGPSPNPGIDAWFDALKRAFPGRILILSDYYGCLGGPIASPSPVQRALFHDVAQLLSGQGIPPRNVTAWRDILDRNGCVLIKALEGHSCGVASFIYLIQI